ncbi:MAG: 50S ribosomal protein L2 [Patescibacteria group bacterium]|nr:50S ribosomal protein L2 [Patescibacteria group bacterium]
MRMKHYKPTTPSRRQMTTVDYTGISNERPLKSLTAKVSGRGGRNHHGRITMRHQGGGNKKIYRVVDFRQMKLDVPGRVEALEYDPFRTAFIARVVFLDGERSYVLAPKDLKVGDSIVTSPKAPLKAGNRLMLKNVPIGYQVHNVEATLGRGGQLARSAGSYVEVLGHEGKYSVVKLASGEVRQVPSEGFATVGQVSNEDWNLVNVGKAGRSRWLGIRPTTRAKAMNPVDHKYGGGEGSTQRGTKRPKDIWGNITGGRKTRNKKKWTGKLIMSRRPKK